MSKRKNFFVCLVLLIVSVAVQIFFGGEAAMGNPNPKLLIGLISLRFLTLGFILFLIARTYRAAKLSQKMAVFLFLVSLEQVPLKLLFLIIDRTVHPAHWPVDVSLSQMIGGLLMGFASAIPVMLIFGFFGFSMARASPAR